MRLVHNVETKSKKSNPSLSIILSNEDLKGVCLPHDDPLVVSLIIANFEVQKILVDSGNIVDILFYEAFLRIKLPTN